MTAKINKEIEARRRIAITNDTNLGLAILVVESEGGEYLPIGVAVSISEALELAQADLNARMRSADKGALCPYQYLVWVDGHDGYEALASIEA